MSQAIQKRIKNDIIFNSILINLFILMLLLLFFEPTTKSDDYDMAMVLYGALDGMYSSFVMYSSHLFSICVSFFLRVIPSVSWYYVIQYILIYISGVVIFFLVKKCSKRKHMVLLRIIYFIIGYELYIRITFTKTAGIVITAGLLSLLYFVEIEKDNIRIFIIGIVLVVIGASIRYGMFFAISVPFSGAVITGLILMGKSNRMKVVLKYIKTLTVLLIAVIGFRYVDNSIGNSDVAWEKYKNVNSARARLQDYSMPDYTEYFEEYKKLNISYNDYIMFKEWGLYNDYDYFDEEKLRKIAEFNVINENQTFYDFINYVAKSIVNHYYHETGFYILSILVILFWVSSINSLGEARIAYLPIVGMCIATYVYLSYLGRVQHHVDVSILIAGAIFLSFYHYKSYREFNEKKTAVCLLLLFNYLSVFYTQLKTASYYDVNVYNQKEYYSSNKRIMDLLSSDKKHVYQFCPITTNSLYDCVFTPFEIIPQNYYSNLGMTNRYYIPAWDKIAFNYGIDNYYAEATNSDRLLFVDNNENEEWIQGLQVYINEHYSPNARYIKVKEIQSVNIYRFIDENYNYEGYLSDATINDDIVADVEIEEVDDKIHIEGYAYIPQEDSYGQNVYISLEDNKTGEKLYRCVEQFENSELERKDKYDGSYSGIRTDFLTTKNDFSIWIYIENDGKTYKKQVK